MCFPKLPSLVSSFWTNFVEEVPQQRTAEDRSRPLMSSAAQEESPSQRPNRIKPLSCVIETSECVSILYLSHEYEQENRIDPLPVLLKSIHYSPFTDDEKEVHR